MTENTSMTIINSHKQLANSDKALDKLTPDELRHQFDERTMAHRRNQAALQAANYAYEDGKYKLKAGVFFREWLPWIAHGDDDITRLIEKEFSKHTGDLRTEFQIVHDDTGEVLFDVVGFRPKVITLMDDYEANAHSLTVQMIEDQYDVRYQFARLRNQLRSESIHKAYWMNEEAADHDGFYLGWYEVLDFFGRLHGEEAEQYNHVREIRKKEGRHFFWKGSIPIDEYIEKHGRMTYGVPANIDPTLGLLGETNLGPDVRYRIGQHLADFVVNGVKPTDLTLEDKNSNENKPVSVVEYEDTDDWE